MFGTSFKALLTYNLTSKHSASANYKKDKEEFSSLLSLLSIEEIESEKDDTKDDTVECEETAILHTDVDMTHSL